MQAGVTGFGIIPYFTLTAAAILEMLSSNEIKLEIPYSARIKDIRMKLKNKNKIVIGNTQYNYYLLQDNRFLKKSLMKLLLLMRFLLIILT